MALRSRVILAIGAVFDSSFQLLFLSRLNSVRRKADAQSDRPQAGQKIIVR
jgi:hypothetical protein